MSNQTITTVHLNTALDLAAKHGFKARDIAALTVCQDGGVTIELPADKDGLVRFVSNRGFGM